MYVEQVLTVTYSHSIAVFMGSSSCALLTTTPISTLRNDEAQKPIGFSNH